MRKFYDLHMKFWEEGMLEYARKLGFSDIAVSSGEYGKRAFELDAAKIHGAPGNGIIIAASENDEALCAAARRRDVDILFCPSFSPSAKLVKTAVENEKVFEVPIDGLLREKGAKRAFLLSRISRFLKICMKSRTDFVLTSRATSKLFMRSPSEFASVGTALGITQDQAQRALAEVPEWILEKKGML